MKTRFFIYQACLSWFLIAWSQCFAQVKNDNIENRIELKINAAPTSSETNGCTVQWKCVDETLTGKAIDYHNDQWFWFKPEAAGTYYINVSGQRCRDIRGVQVVVISGEPCQPKTYKIPAFASLASQDDIFIQLDSLIAGQPYLLNIDGYLHDFCKFNIQVSTKAQGNPVKPVQEKRTVVKLAKNIAHFSWEVPESQATEMLHYRLLRRKADEPAFSIIKTIPHKKNTIGVSALAYACSDTLPSPGNYFYNIVAVRSGEPPLLLGEHNLTYQQQPNETNFISLVLDYKPGTSLDIYIYNAQTKALLQKNNIKFQKKHRRFDVFTGKLKQAGTTALEVKIVNRTNNTSVSRLYKL